MQIHKQWVNAEAIAEMWGMSVESVRRGARLGTLPSVKVGRLVRFDPEAVERALMRRAEQPRQV